MRILAFIAIAAICAAAAVLSTCIPADIPAESHYRAQTTHKPAWGFELTVDQSTGRVCHRCHYEPDIAWCEHWTKAPMLDAERFFWLQDPKILFRNVQAYRDYDAWLQNPPPMLAEGREAHKRRTKD